MANPTLSEHVRRHDGYYSIKARLVHNDGTMAFRSASSVSTNHHARRSA